MSQQLSQVNVRLTANNVDYIRKLIKAQDETKKNTEAMGKQFDAMNKKIKTAAQGMGYQIQDIAVQAQMGTDNLIILAQQGPQILSLLGPMGALAGAGLAIASAMGMAAKAGSDLDASNESLVRSSKSVIEKLREMADEAQYLNAVQVEYLQKQDKATIKSLNEQITKQKAVMETIDRRVQQTGRLSKEDQKQYEQARVAMSVYEQDLKEAEERHNSYNKVLRHSTQSKEDDIDAINRQHQAIEDLIGTYRIRSEIQDKSERQQEIANALAQAGTDILPKQRERLVQYINTLYDKIDKQKADAKAVKDAAKAEVERQKQLAKTQREQRKAAAEQKRFREQQAAELVKFEQQRIEERNKRLNDVAKQIASQRNSMMTPEQIELEQFRENSELLKNELSMTKQWEYSERARINQLIEQEQQRHADSMSMISTQQTMNDLNNMNVFLGGMSDITSKLGNISKENETLAKVAFVANQGIAIANTIVATELAAAKALAYTENMTLPQALASQQAIRAMGYASAGIIAGTTIGGLATGQYHGGTDSVPESMNNKSFLLKAGERVVQPKANQDLTEYLANAKDGNNGSVTISAPMTINGNVTDRKWFATELAKHQNLIYALHNKAKRERPRRG
ncbi:TPA: hypothetical protein NJ458_003382 [Vibrio parahaemolyticus]|uniref:hypothetical protein n=1 Tax=Vibrio parahaemolyticus TaxID=670 RepID=UPI001121827F|nr:hypothetical protein [Vibrio parahaemolyticus]EGU0167927.1 hypothetical protein [Vibrio parahaemolyticus]EHH1170556.1 hypothetical protein [Vibrio parahaemolyticus]MBE4403117.1 hypothetical protein [Vibrio parahaemolyticus]TNY71718.1 hypothetical protein CGK63_15795 [Vibrio parahaemolyticus]TON19352.1 hypothetical protein CGH61_18580 [Vibrio parahaemolyticus]